MCIPSNAEFISIGPESPYAPIQSPLYLDLHIPLLTSPHHAAWQWWSELDFPTTVASKGISKCLQSRSTGAHSIRLKCSTYIYRMP